jgi:hypothetical protein
MGGFGVGEEAIEIILNDGTVIDGLAFVQRLVHVWDGVFATAGTA